MAGLFLSFSVDYLGARFVQWRQNKHTASSTEAAVPSDSDDKLAADSSSSPTPDHYSKRSHGLLHAHNSTHTVTPMEEKINVMNLEAGIIFHSIREYTYPCHIHLSTNPF